MCRTAPILVSLVLVGGAAGAGQHPEHGSGTADHNYYHFIGADEPCTSCGDHSQGRILLTQVEQYHFYNCPHQPPGATENGPFADMRQASYDKAISDLDYVLERFVNHPQALQLLGIAARLSNKLSLPISRFERALRHYPEYAPTHYLYGAYLLDIGDLQAALGSLTRAVELDPNLAPAHAALSTVHARSGDASRAAAAAERARALGFKGAIAGAKPGKRE